MILLFIRFPDSPFAFTPPLSGSSSISDYNTEQQTTQTRRKTSPSPVFPRGLMIASLTDVQPACPAGFICPEFISQLLIF